MSLILLGEEFPQFVCLEHPESCILNKIPKPFSTGITRFYLNAVFCALAFLRSYVFKEE